MKQRNILLFLLLFAVLGSQAQKLTVESFSVAPGDIDARSSETRRTDRNGTPCALVKVQLPLQGAVFDGVVGDVQFRAGTYWAYLPNGAYLMSISHPQFHRLDLNLRSLWNGEERFYGVEQLTTYNLIINVPQTGQAETRTQKLVINYTPVNAMVIIDSKSYRGNGNVEVELPLGEHSYIVAAEGYVTVEGTIKLNGGKQRVLPVPLDKEEIHVSATHSQSSPATSQKAITRQTPFEREKEVPFPQIIETFVNQIYSNSTSFDSVVWECSSNKFDSLMYVYGSIYKELSSEDLDRIDEAIDRYQLIARKSVSNKEVATITVDEIEYDDSESPSNEWKDKYARICRTKIGNMNLHDFEIPKEMMELHPCLVYLLLKSKSISSTVE